MSRGPTEAEVDAADELSRGIPKGALASALSVGTSRAAAQNQTLGNIRSRTAALLPTSVISVTFATSIGLLANDPSKGGGVRMSDLVAGFLLAFVIAIGAVTVVVQWPVKWDFDSGTDVYKVGGEDGDPALRAAIKQLELVIGRNSRRLRRSFLWFEFGVVLLGLETVLVLVGLIFSGK